MTKYTHLFIDLDDTVLDFHKGQENAFYDACKKLNVPVTSDDYVRYDKINDSVWKMFERGEMEKKRLMVYRYELFLEPFNLQEKAEELNKEYALQLSKQGVFLEGAKEGLLSLKNRYKIDIITNGTTFIQKGRMAVCGLDKMIDMVFISDEIGYRKPTIEYFQYCLKTLNVAKENVLVIGDSLTSDIVGAVQANIDCVFFNPEQKPCPYPVVKNVRNWQEFLDFLGEKS